METAMCAGAEGELRINLGINLRINLGRSPLDNENTQDFYWQPPVKCWGFLKVGV